MQIILLERVPKLGQMGEVVTVRPGYARNFLIPTGKALRATKAAIADFEKRRTQLEARNLERKQDAQTLAAKVDGRSVTILRQASETSQLYGSVNARDITTAFVESGLTLDRQQIRLEEPLKTLGLHKVAVALHPEVEVTVTVNVARSKEEADIQAGVAAPVEDEEEREPTLEEELEALI
jgi:large subunit ribosomal protein L9